jgi:hypothetical protein
MNLRDPETGKVALINTGSKQLREKWERHRADQNWYLADLVKRAGVDLVELTTNRPVIEPLMRLFEGKTRRRST